MSTRFRHFIARCVLSSALSQYVGSLAIPVSHFRSADVAIAPYESWRFADFGTLLAPYNIAATAATFDSLGLKICGLKPKTTHPTSCPTSYRTPTQHNRSPSSPLHKIYAFLPCPACSCSVGTEATGSPSPFSDHLPCRSTNSQIKASFVRLKPDNI